MIGWRCSGVVSTMSMTAGLGSMVQWSLGDGCDLMDGRGEVTLFAVVVASTTVRPGQVNALITPEGGMAEDGDS